MEIGAVPASTSDPVTLAKADRKPGIWSATDVMRMLEAGILTPEDGVG